MSVRKLASTFVRLGTFRWIRLLSGSKDRLPILVAVRVTTSGVIEVWARFRIEGQSNYTPDKLVWSYDLSSEVEAKS